MNYKLINLTLQYAPEEIIDLIDDIYTISIVGENTEFRIYSSREGRFARKPLLASDIQHVLQPSHENGDAEEKHEHLGYMWGPTAEMRSRSWL